ncbi:hypothetical protein W911_09135 [Hyphomicrobium nitrativorans NL23]|uniref:Uncharacterized protein n=1 Tax=Hyphomicrobium nitrativorans NL23 TaxID=1029756 RepID=V5SEY2_9HYPH|nr:hypothetical protein [Hyphomicrobium nitrativorans]AHB48519.1 hypothetical protein W911_09135 [Hyphomicrobium nitrativorans NL23]
MTRTRFAVLSAAALALAAGAAPAASSSGTFNALHGAWTGSGSVRLENGTTQRIRCRGYYTARSGGAALGMAINCSNSANFKIHMRANLTSSGNQINGSWEEREFNQTGSVNGRASGNGFNLSFSGAISGSMAVSLSGSRQTVNISTGGPGFTGVNMQFAKSG